MTHIHFPSQRREKQGHSVDFIQNSLLRELRRLLQAVIIDCMTIWRNKNETNVKVSGRDSHIPKNIYIHREKHLSRKQSFLLILLVHKVRPQNFDEFIFSFRASGKELNRPIFFVNPKEINSLRSENAHLRERMETLLTREQQREPEIHVLRTENAKTKEEVHNYRPWNGKFLKSRLIDLMVCLLDSRSCLLKKSVSELIYYRGYTWRVYEWCSTVVVIMEMVFGDCIWTQFLFYVPFFCLCVISVFFILRYTSILYHIQWRVAKNSFGKENQWVLSTPRSICSLVEKELDHQRVHSALSSLLMMMMINGSSPRTIWQKVDDDVQEPVNTSPRSN